MKLKDFDFNLPQQLIAQYPLPKRSSSRLLYLNGKTNVTQHHKFTDIIDLINPKDLLIFNDTKVIPARLFARKLTGAKVEILIERILGDNRVLAQLKANKPLKSGTNLIIENYCEAQILDKKGDFCILKFQGVEDILSILKTFGHVPLPPYINRKATKLDQERYQTIYAKREGAVAAPTAGLHFDKEILEKIIAKGIATAYLTLHVGAGTFQPVRTINIEQHQMHSEYIEVDEKICGQITKTRNSGGRVIAVGTTCVRSLESATQNEVTTPFCGETDIFIYPGYKFQCVDALITNFHLPKSTLLMLICAFGGYDKVMQAYREAVAMQYRFFSYGDAMFIARGT